MHFHYDNAISKALSDLIQVGGGALVVERRTPNRELLGSGTRLTPDCVLEHCENLPMQRIFSPLKFENLHHGNISVCTANKPLNA